MVDDAIVNAQKLVAELERQRAEFVRSGDVPAPLENALPAARRALEALQAAATSSSSAQQQ
jgi:hypothetical protein